MTDDAVRKLHARHCLAAQIGKINEFWRGFQGGFAPRLDFQTASVKPGLPLGGRTSATAEGGHLVREILTIVTSDELSGVTTPPPKPTSCAKQPTSAIRRIVLRENVGDCVWVA